MYHPRLRRILRRNRFGIGLFLMAAVLFILLFCVNRFTLSIHLKGDPQIQLEYGEEYEDPGAEAVMYGTMFLKGGVVLPNVRIDIQNQIEKETLGRYPVSYSASFLGWKADAERTVCIIDTLPPEILVSKVWAHGQPNDDFDPMRGVTAVDNYDGDITDKVVWSVTTGWITYSVIDSSGNPAYIISEANVAPSQPPEIKLNGGDQYVITVGSFYSDPGFEATDSADGDLTDKVLVEGDVDWLNPGTYPITYTVADSMGNSTSVTREVYVEAMPQPKVQWPQNKTIYLTFDDGPGPYTPQLLKILDKYGVKATFFVTDSGYDSVMREIVSHGHSIGIHTVTHDYGEIYASPEAFFEDLRKMQDIIYRNTGVYTTLFRFPGGSSNTVSMETCEGLMTILTEAVPNAGFQYFDWNVDSDDAGSALKTETVFNNVIDGIRQQGIAAVLQHDIHGYSVDAVESIILWGLEHGYTFLPLTDRSPGFHHDIQN